MKNIFLSWRNFVLKKKTFGKFGKKWKFSFLLYYNKKLKFSFKIRFFPNFSKTLFIIFFSKQIFSMIKKYLNIFHPDFFLLQELDLSFPTPPTTNTEGVVDYSPFFLSEIFHFFKEKWKFYFGDKTNDLAVVL